MTAVQIAAAPEASASAITRAAAIEAGARDEDGAFPRAALDALHALGVIDGLSVEDQAIDRLLQTLAAIGRGSLPVGRIVEGHVNACLLVERFGTAAQRKFCRDLATQGRLLGIWNTDLPGCETRLDGRRLEGRKSYATGIDGLSHAVVTAQGAEGRQMILLPLDRVAVDRTWWRAQGMRATGSHVAILDGIEIDPAWRLGQPGDYLAEPLFTAGAIRFTAVTAGGLHAVHDATLTELKERGRADAPYQRHRLARTAVAVQSAYLWLGEAARVWSAASRGRRSPDELVATVRAARFAVSDAAGAALAEAEAATGAAGLMAPHPLERLGRDLRTYLRQPDPDGSLADLGGAVAGADWSPAWP